MIYVNFYISSFINDDYKPVPLPTLGIQLSTVNSTLLYYPMPSAMQSNHQKKSIMWKFSDDAEKKNCGKITQLHAH